MNTLTINGKNIIYNHNYLLKIFFSLKFNQFYKHVYKKLNLTPLKNIFLNPNVL